MVRLIKKKKINRFIDNESNHNFFISMSLVFLIFMFHDKYKLIVFSCISRETIIICISLSVPLILWGLCLIQIRLNLLWTLSPRQTAQYLHTHFLLCCLLFPISSPHSNDSDLNRICGTSRLSTDYLLSQRELI